MRIIKIIFVSIFSNFLSHGWAQVKEFSQEKLDQIATEEIVEKLGQYKYYMPYFGKDLSKEEKGLSRYIAALHYRPFHVIDSLFFSDSDIKVRVYCFGKLVQLYPDSLKDTHLTILTNKEEILVNFQFDQGIRKMTACDLTSNMYNGLLREREDAILQVEFEKIVTEFILNYSAFPDSYQPISFQRFGQVSEDLYMNKTKQQKLKYQNQETGSLEGRVIHHTYRLKDVNGKLQEVTHVFNFYPNMMPMIIGEETNTVWCDPPRIDEWLNSFGRALTDVDRKNLGI